MFYNLKMQNFYVKSPVIEIPYNVGWASAHRSKLRFTPWDDGFTYLMWWTRKARRKK